MSVDQLNARCGIPRVCLARAVVVLHSSGVTMQATDQDGHIVFPGLKPGRYQLAFCSEGYYPELRSVRVKAGKISRVRVRLRISDSATSGCEGLAKPS
jgi:5-hydroxyisourate hydrolase-like protein (transthyretin family)